MIPIQAQSRSEDLASDLRDIRLKEPDLASIDGAIDILGTTVDVREHYAQLENIRKLRLR